MCQYCHCGHYLCAKYIGNCYGTDETRNAIWKHGRAYCSEKCADDDPYKNV